MLFEVKLANSEMLNKAQKLLLGIVLLVLVDVIWVSSSELTKVGIYITSMKETFFNQL